MKTVLTTLNAKYIHTSLALRLLYTVNRPRHNLEFREYTIKENTEKIAEELLASGADIIGLGVYIWNVEQTCNLVALLKEKKKELVIILGGPEVSYEPAFFLENWAADYVVQGEGEFVLGELLDEIKEGSIPQIAGVSVRNNPDYRVAKADIERLEMQESPYMLEADRESMQNRLVYFESSRGCPYQCHYCLSSLEKGVRYYSREYIERNLTYLIESGAKQIKFLDRTFNLNKEHTFFIFDFLIRNYRPGLVCQFEIYADILTDEVIEYLNENLPDNYFRFEIGIQSTYEPTNKAVNRIQDFERLSRNIKKLVEGGKVALHLDLIAGLPFESFDRFVRSFNDVFAFQVKEIQLGFLKMLRGTALRKRALEYGYLYEEKAPYEVICSGDISREELGRIHEAEHALERYWNSGRFTRTMNHLVHTEYAGRYFELFDEIALFYIENNYPQRGYQLEDLFRCLHAFLKSKGIELFSLLRTDYYSNFTIRPHGFWTPLIDKKTKKQLLYQIAQDKEFLIEHGLTRKIIEKQTAIDMITENRYLLTVFFSEKRGELYIIVYDLKNN